jgi:DNA processing protein
MATGPDSIYPHRHLEFAERLISTPGSALVTDYPPGTAPLAIHFLRRNRIIAGMSDATILVESKIRGGGMMTARLAYSYNRDVYALPGRIDDSRSQGCNLLIKEKIAEAVDSVDGMMDSVGMKRSREGILPTATEVIMDRFSGKTDHGTVMELAAIARTIRIRRGITLDDLSATLRCDYSRISRLAGMLEMEGVISVDLLQRCTLNIRISR